MAIPYTAKTALINCKKEWYTQKKSAGKLKTSRHDIRTTRRNFLYSTILYALRNNMNRHSFLQFNPRSYKKHLSPLGQNVLEHLIQYWRTGLQNNESRRRHQLLSDQSRRNGDYSNSRSILSIPSSPVGQTNHGREICQITNDIDTTDYLIRRVPVNQACEPFRSMGDTNFENDIYKEPNYIDDCFAIPRVPIRRASELPKSTSSTSYEKDVTQATRNTKKNLLMKCQDGLNYQIPPFKDVVSAQTHTLQDGARSGISNAAIIASDELVKTIEIPNSNEEEILTANDTITPVIDFDKVHDNFMSRRKHIDNIENSNISSMKFLENLEILNKGTNEKIISVIDEVLPNRKDNVKNDVEWVDMFDTELLSDIRGPEILMKPLQDDTGNFRIEFHKDKKKNLKVCDSKVTKRKIPLKNTNTFPKVKKIKSDIVHKLNESFRKVTYEKTVNTWLDDVDPNNLVDYDDGLNDVSDIIQLEAATIHKTSEENTNANGMNKLISDDVEVRLKEKAKGKTLDIQIETKVGESVKPVLDETAPTKASNMEIEKKPKQKCNKKIIQAKLAQKDGKMKYKLPSKGLTESKPELVDENEKKNKEKKVKLKFDAPIKSQIPVKNVVFDVHTLNESNSHLICDVFQSEVTDIAMILIYSNGFCQLNKHHTEETCVPEGVMVQWQDKYFLFKDNQHRDLMKQLLEKFHVICYNGKLLLLYLISKYGIELKQDFVKLIDAKIGGSLIDPDHPPENFAELQKLLSFTPEFTVATECVLQKAAWYTTLLRECYTLLKLLLIENSVWSVFVEIEMRLLPVIAGMEYRGVCVALDKLRSMENILLTKMKAVEQECYRAAGKTFQINSTLQVRTILYDELQLDTKSNLKIKETIGKGAKSTSESMLRGLVSVHPLPRLILEYRHLHKAHATFLTGIAQHVNDGTVKSTWVQTAAATGRIASNNPNLQAIPKAPFSLVMFPENSENLDPQLNFRAVYTARPQHWLVAADFKHVECRVFAHASADVTLLDALRSDQDLFRVLAAKWLNKPVDDVSTEDRERTKRIVYASLYGAGARKLMEILQVGYEQALGVMTSFNRTFPALKSFGRAVVERATAGALRSLCGRARRFPHIGGADAALRAQAERQAVNFVVQGSAADLCKKAMVEVQRRLEENPPVQGYLVLQIHDELVWEVADGDVDRAVAIIKEVMEHVGRQCGMDMTLPVELTRGRSWGEMQPYTTNHV